MGFAANFFDAFKGVEEDRGVGDAFATTVFFGVGSGVPFEIGFGVFFGRAIGEELACGLGAAVGVGAGSSSSLFTGGTINSSGGATFDAGESGVGSGGFSGGTAPGVEVALTSPALASIHRISVGTGFVALPLQRAKPSSTTTCAIPISVTLRQKLASRDIAR
ncbi:MAG: hypothetical protein M3505_02015 [Verrucomicrobiota bacterium]|nr:hypothetical protein [Verrucomicrobiota bacterium]